MCASVATPMSAAMRVLPAIKEVVIDLFRPWKTVSSLSESDSRVADTARRKRAENSVPAPPPGPETLQSTDSDLIRGRKRRTRGNRFLRNCFGTHGLRGEVEQIAKSPQSWASLLTGTGLDHRLSLRAQAQLPVRGLQLRSLFPEHLPVLQPHFELLPFQAKARLV